MNTALCATLKRQNHRKVMTQSHGSKMRLDETKKRIRLFYYNYGHPKKHYDRQTTKANSMEAKDDD